MASPLPQGLDAFPDLEELVVSATAATASATAADADPSSGRAGSSSGGGARAGTRASSRMPLPAKLRHLTVRSNHPLLQVRVAPPRPLDPDFHSQSLPPPPTAPRPHPWLGTQWRPKRQETSELPCARGRTVLPPLTLPGVRAPQVGRQLRARVQVPKEWSDQLGRLVRLPTLTSLTLDHLHGSTAFLPRLAKQLTALDVSSSFNW